MPYIKIMRPWQWVKNLLIFIPYILTEKYNSILFIDIFLIFITFSLFVSATYVLNDIRDKSLDALHSQKKKRPISSGVISEINGKIFSYSLLSSSLLITYFININSIYYFLAYLFATTIYSRYLKYVFFLDTILISLMFALRLFIGGVISNVEITNYLFLFVYLSSCILSYSKKISILNSNKLDKENKYLNLLIDQNKKINFDKIYFSLSFLSSVCFFSWSVNLYQSTEIQVNILYLLLSIFCYILFCYFVFTESKKGFVEDFSSALLKKTSLTLTSFFIVLMFILGYF